MGNASSHEPGALPSSAQTWRSFAPPKADLDFHKLEPAFEILNYIPWSSGSWIKGAV